MGEPARGPAAPPGPSVTAVFLNGPTQPIAARLAAVEPDRRPELLQTGWLEQLPGGERRGPLRQVSSRGAKTRSCIPPSRFVEVDARQRVVLPEIAGSPLTMQ